MNVNQIIYAVGMTWVEVSLVVVMIGWGKICLRAIKRHKDAIIEERNQDGYRN